MVLYKNIVSLIICIFVLIRLLIEANLWYNKLIN